MFTSNCMHMEALTSPVAGDGAHERAGTEGERDLPTGARAAERVGPTQVEIERWMQAAGVAARMTGAAAAAVCGPSPQCE